MGWLASDLYKYFEVDSLTKFKRQLTSLTNQKRKNPTLIKNSDFTINSSGQKLYQPQGVIKLEKIFKKRVKQPQYVDRKDLLDFKRAKYDDLKIKINDFLRSPIKNRKALVLSSDTVNVLDWDKSQSETLYAEIQKISSEICFELKIRTKVIKDLKNKNTFFLTKLN